MPSKRFWLILVAIVCLVAVIAGSAGYSHYKKGRPASLTRAAENALNRSDYQEASLLARRALQLNPDFLPACNVMAEICEKIGIYDTVRWRKQAAYLSGGATDSLIAYANASVQYHEDEVAQATLARVPASDRKRADFLAVSGALAINAGRYAEAEHFYSEATRLEPANQSYRFSLGKAQTSSTDFFTRETGRNLLASMIGQGEFDLPARRTLILSYEAGNETGSALRESRKLVNTPGHTFADEILNLRLLHNVDDPELIPALAAAEKKSTTNEKDAALLLHWMSVEGLSAQAVEWAAKRTPAVGRMPAARPWLARAYLELHDWAALLAISQDGSWKQMEHVRHAYRTRAMREQGNLILANSEWKMAVASAGDVDAVSWLVKFSTDWNMPNEQEQALWAAVEKPQLAREALANLYRHYTGQKDTANLRSVAERLVQIDPANEDAQNNFAMFSLLRDRDSSNASQTARKLYQQHPENPVYASTYAFALQHDGRSSEAQQVLESLPESQLEEPAIAAYYGIILSANHRREKARHFLDIARNSPLLPEESLLVEKALLAVEPDPPKAP